MASLEGTPKQCGYLAFWFDFNAGLGLKLPVKGTDFLIKGFMNIARFSRQWLCASSLVVAWSGFCTTLVVPNYSATNQTANGEWMLLSVSREQTVYGVSEF